MADNVLVDEGGDKTIATDDVGNVHYQKIKLDLGGDGVSSPLVRGQQTKANSLPVALASDTGTLSVDVGTLPALPAGTNNIGDVDIASIAAGDNNIGNVDVVSLPSLPAGTNAIGKLAANNGVDIGDVDVTSLPALPAGTNIIGGTRTRDVSGEIVDNADGVTALTVKRAKFLGSADANLVAFVTGKKIRVLSLVAQQQHTADATVNIKFNDSEGNDIIDTAPEFTFTKVGDGAVLPYNPHGWFQTEADGEGIDVDVSAAVTVMIHITYAEVD